MKHVMRKIGRGAASMVGAVGVTATYLVTTSLLLASATVALVGMVIASPFYYTYAAYTGKDPLAELRKADSIVANINPGFWSATRMFLGGLLALPFALAMLAIIVGIIAPLVVLAAAVVAPIWGAYQGQKFTFLSVLKDIVSFGVPEIVLAGKVIAAESDSETVELRNEFLAERKNEDDAEESYHQAFPQAARHPVNSFAPQYDGNDYQRGLAAKVQSEGLLVALGEEAEVQEPVSPTTGLCGCGFFGTAKNSSETESDEDTNSDTSEFSRTVSTSR